MCVYNYIYITIYMYIYTRIQASRYVCIHMYTYIRACNVEKYVFRKNERNYRRLWNSLV